eukprot:TCALIF_10727-PA protein Name:"Protein of unknown function" AED:0.41 eAED:0.41 QI:0/0.33/0.4/0.4/1/1/10/143/554
MSDEQLVTLPPPAKPTVKMLPTYQEMMRKHREYPTVSPRYYYEYPHPNSNEIPPLDESDFVEMKPLSSEDVSESSAAGNFTLSVMNDTNKEDPTDNVTSVLMELEQEEQEERAFVDDEEEQFEFEEEDQEEEEEEDEEEALAEELLGQEEEVEKVEETVKANGRDEEEPLVIEEQKNNLCSSPVDAPSEPSRLGLFTLSTLFEGYPVYSKKASSQHLFFKLEFDRWEYAHRIERWVVGPMIGEAEGGILFLTQEMCPWKIDAKRTEVFFYHKKVKNTWNPIGNGWKLDDSISINCYNPDMFPPYSCSCDKFELFSNGNIATLHPEKIGVYELQEFRSLDGILSPLYKHHWNSPETLALIRLGSWDAVIIQEYSTGLAKSDEKLCQSSYPFARNLIEEIRVHSPEAKIQFYQTWGRPYGEAVTCPDFPPNCEYLTMQDVITDNYSNYACQFQPAQVAPVGESFRYIRENEGDERFFELYETLGLADHHPSLQGSYLSACAHYLSLFGGSIRGNTFEAGLDPEVVAYLQNAADAVYSNTDWTFDNTCQSCKCECNQ